jgi:uroporphyrinogen decarboxylase-like protein
MTNKKERYYSALRNQGDDKIVWAPNFDWWYNVNKANGTLPPEYTNFSRSNISRDVGGAIWRRTRAASPIYDGVEVEIEATDTTRRVEYKTPVGCLEENYTQSSGTFFRKGHLIRKVEDIRIAKYIAEATDYELDLDDYYQQLDDVGDDGIVLSQEGCCVPFIQFGKQDAGWVEGLYMWNDNIQEVEGLLEAYTQRAVRQYTVLADSQIEVISTSDNMDQLTFPPNLFERYAISYYQQIAEILHKKDKIFKVHWCGQTQNLLGYLPETGIDVVEAVAVEPMAPLTVREALDKLEGKIVMQGGIAAVMVCEEGGTDGDFDKYMQDLLNQVRPNDPFILGMSDNVPANADFGRVKKVAELLKKRDR